MSHYASGDERTTPVNLDTSPVLSGTSTPLGLDLDLKGQSGSRRVRNRSRLGGPLVDEMNEAKEADASHHHHQMPLLSSSENGSGGDIALQALSIGGATMHPTGTPQVDPTTYHERFLTTTPPSKDPLHQGGPWPGVEIKRWMRTTAFVCSCVVGIGGHFAAHTLGPLKDDVKQHLGINNAQFGVMQASLSLVPTILPFLGGLFVDRFGTGPSSMIAITTIVLGQLLVMWGAFSGLFGRMVAGYVLFGMGEGWMVVISETILVHFFHGRGLAVMIGLQIAIGKCASFLATGTAVHITKRTGFYGNVFVVAVMMCLLSWGCNLGYLFLVRHLNQQARRIRHARIRSTWSPAPTSDDDGPSFQIINSPEFQHTRKSSLSKLAMGGDTQLDPSLKAKRPRLGKVFEFSDVVWWFFLMCFLFGAVWIPFIHLSSNIIKVEYQVSDAEAAWVSSLVFALPMVLNPILGVILDRVGRVAWFVFASSVCLILAVGSVLYPIIPWSVLPILFFSASVSMGALAQITAIPLMLPPLSPHLATGTVLGIRRCVEHIGAILVDTLSGQLQDMHIDRRYTYVLQTFFILACLTMLAVLVWAKLDRQFLSGILCKSRQVRPVLLEHLQEVYDKYGIDLSCHPIFQTTAINTGLATPFGQWWARAHVRKIAYIIVTAGLLGLSWLVFAMTTLAVYAPQ
ncbi:hypothetical protein IWQ62_005228 [Dispira parvispora]|uniref:Lysosomal dipeptide transporter MFSD1 n=1 Tax=Dispira parvispora TaxID=1520584 RepID=A0A9W8E186_9FUNG|nr:hypothetical protein IWQ62_005228 [Dispira parvispora]